jgi:hypothetical protein
VKRSGDLRRTFLSLTAPPPPDQLGGRGEWDSQGTVHHGPHLSYMVMRDGARNHPLGSPIRELSQGPSWPTL